MDMVLFCLYAKSIQYDRGDIMATQGKIRIYKREAKKGFTYTFCIEAGRNPKTGKRQRVTKSGFKTQKDARNAAQHLLNKLLIGKNIVESNITFAQYADEWLNEYKTGLKPHTIQSFESKIRTINKYLGNVKMRDITLYEYQQFLNEYALKVKKSTLSELHTCVKMIFRQALRYNIILNNPTLDAYLPKKQEEVKDVSTLYLTKDELDTLLTYVKITSVGIHSYRYYLMMLMAYTGMRIGEVCALSWEDIDFKAKTISVHSSMFAKNLDTYLKQSTPKTSSSIRKIIIDNNMIELLKAWKVKQLELRIRYATMNKHDKDNYVFTKYNQKRDYEFPILPPSMSIYLANIDKKRIVSKHLHPHLLRHTHASLLAEAGISLEAIQERLGHLDKSLTRRVYLHITEKHKQNVADLFAKYMQG